MSDKTTLTWDELVAIVDAGEVQIFEDDLEDSRPLTEFLNDLSAWDELFEEGWRYDE